MLRVSTWDPAAHHLECLLLSYTWVESHSWGLASPHPKQIAAHVHEQSLSGTFELWPLGDLYCRGQWAIMHNLPNILVYVPVCSGWPAWVLTSSPSRDHLLCGVLCCVWAMTGLKEVLCMRSGVFRLVSNWVDVSWWYLIHRTKAAIRAPLLWEVSAVLLVWLCWGSYKDDLE